MKIIFSEGPVQYSDYTFNYAVYALPLNSEIEEAYANGFLPYTGNYKLKDNHYYLCRSLRVNLNTFKINSENRRIFKQLDHETLEHSVLKTSEVLENPELINFCQNYTKERFQGGAMDLERMKHVFQWNNNLLFHRFDYNGELVGLILCMESGKTRHYWFSFFSLSPDQPRALGKYLMTKMIKLSQDEKLDNIYLGTCYGPHSLYKARDFNGMEFFDGSQWNNSLSELKIRCKEDASDKIVLTDRMKMTNFEL